jgi:tetratricopeptide (TPR) repeat protein
LLPTLVAVAQNPSSEQRARQAYEAAWARLKGSRTNAMAGWQFGRAAYDLADMTHDDQERSEVAQAGIDACREAASLDVNSAAAYYYLALNLGELARGKKLGALKLLHEMEHALLRAAQLDPAFDYAGPDRALGMLYQQAPGWPVSIGNRNKARTHLQSAVELSPEYPENLISLAEAYAAWGEVRNLEAQLDDLSELLPKARLHFTGDTWAASWKDWERRLQKLRSARDRLLASPRISPAERGAKSAR